MIISATFSKPTKLVQEKFNREYLRIRIKLNTSSQSEKKYSVEYFTEKQAFHSQLEEEVPNVNRVCYDLSPKPSATIEWE